MPDVPLCICQVCTIDNYGTWFSNISPTFVVGKNDLQLFESLENNITYHKKVSS